MTTKARLASIAGLRGPVAAAAFAAVALAAATPGAAAPGAADAGARGSAATGVPAQVRLHSSGAGQYLTDLRGMTLYTSAGDTVAGKSACVGDCATAWPPLRAVAGAAAPSSGDWSLIARDDGASQWAWRGRPLYAYAKDPFPGARLGDGVGHSWRVALQKVPTPPGFAIRSIYLGRILTNASGLTLYWPADAEAAAKRPPGRDWLPLQAPWMAQAHGEWSLAERADGQKQWAFRGHPLFLHAADAVPGDTSGLQATNDWQVAVLDPAPPLPPWVTVQNSDMGEVFADARGHTLYVLAGGLEKIRRLTCDDACIRRNWQAVAAGADARATGDWTIIASPLDPAQRIWALRGDPLFTHTRDREPGAIGGDKWGSGGGNAGPGWMPALRHRDLED